MKHIISIFILVSFSSLSAKEVFEIRDSAYVSEERVVATSGSGNASITNTETITGNNDDRTESKKSNIVYDGSSYSLIFSWKKKKHMDPHWDGIGMAFIGLDGLQGADLIRSASYSFILNMMNYYVPLDRNHWILFTGLGIDWSRYHFEGDVGLTEINGITQFQPAPEGFHYNSSKLLTYYFTFPLMLEYQTRINGKNFFISGGAVGYVKCYSKSQVELNLGKKSQVDKGRDLNILPVNARLMLQIGMGSVCFFGYYSPYSLFEKNKGPEVFPFGIGLRLGGD